MIILKGLYPKIYENRFMHSLFIIFSGTIVAGPEGLTYGVLLLY
jgi:hypothetical protein